MKIYLANKNIKLFATHSERKTQIVERLNRTIKGIMFRYFTKKNTRSYIDIVQDIASNYNASYHRTIKVAPKNVNKNKKTQVWINEEKYEEKKRRKKSKFNVGDFVRLSIERGPFMKRYPEIWTKEVFIIDDIAYGNPLHTK